MKKFYAEKKKQLKKKLVYVINQDRREIRRS